jgi:hypothetical protein
MPVALAIPPAETLRQFPLIAAGDTILINDCAAGQRCAPASTSLPRGVARVGRSAGHLIAALLNSGAVGIDRV